MAIGDSDVILISSDDEDDGETNFVTAAVNPDIVLISSDDDDGERNLDEGVASEHEADYIQFDEYESDKEEDDDVEKLNIEECVDNNNSQGGNDLHALSLNECKTYLRKHGMRVSGTKEECVQRIEEHTRLKDGNAESLYPKSSFSINCTGDACRGDIVLFKQNMYNNQRDIIGRRTVAGRIVNESYSASTEHTFSVEVLWSKWFKKLDPLSILLVKGRNLYQFGTFRQAWESEAERSEVLKEKHERGKEARRKRKWKETEFDVGDNKGKKRHKVSHKVSSHSKHKHANKNTKAHYQDVLFQNLDLKRSTQLTYHSDPNCSMYSDHHLQEASVPFSYDTTLQLNDLPPGSSVDHSHHNNEQQVPNQALSQPPDHHHHASESPVHRSIDEKAMIHFPESSFSINCTGDARERDVVLFKQPVYMRGKVTEKKRTVAGRIVKARQCESGDEHKFLIKVLWTIPSIINRRRFTMRVRSHNLYKYGAFRQPWKNEAMRSKMFEEKHGPVTRKLRRKLKKMDSALNKNKGAKRQKVSHTESSPSKQPTQKASSKRKGAGASPVKKTKTGSKMKSVRLGKRRAKKSKQQTFQPPTNPNTNLDLSLSTNLNQNENSNLIPSTTLNPNPRLHLNPNHNADQNQKLKTCHTQNPNSTDPSQNPNSNLISSTTLKPNPSPHLNPIQHTKPNPNPRQKPNLKPRHNPNQKPRQNPNGPEPNNNPNSNPISSTASNPNLSTDPSQNPNSNPISSTTSKPNPSPHLNPNQHTKSNPNPRQKLNLNPRKNLNLKPRHNPNQKPRQNPNGPEPNNNPNSNPISSTASNPNPSPHLNPNQHTNPNAHQNQSPNMRQSQNPNSTDPDQNPNSNTILSTTLNPSLSPHLNPNQHTKPKPRQNPNPNPRQKPKLSPRQNPNPEPRQNLNPTPRQNPNPKPRQNPNPKPRQNPNPNPRQNPNANPRQNSHPNVSQNPHPHPSYYLPAHQLQESSLFLPNQPPVWVPPNQPPYGFQGYGGQWGPNHNPIQSPGYNYMDILVLAGLTTLWYQQQ
ncbi:putative transcription regulator SAP family [Helianthus debilis subsp. tardiflorus]